MNIHAVVSLIALFGLIHFGISFAGSVLGGTRCENNGGIDNGASVHDKTGIIESLFGILKNSLVDDVFLQ